MNAEHTKHILRGAPSGFERVFVGRSEDLAQLEAAATEREIVALWGPPGVGKTRLGLRIGQRLLETGAYERGGFCALSASDRREDIVAQVARVLDFSMRQRSIDSALEALKRRLATRQVLVILDNAEAVLDVCVELVAELAGVSPQSTFVVTTRHAPQHEAVWSYKVEPLPVADGVELLRRRGSDLQDVPSQTLEAIVSRLEGLPLSIELAAGRLPVYSCRQLLERLENQLETLKDYDDRRSRWEATLLRSLEASWPLLSRAEQSGLVQCSIFQGDFSLESAQNVLDLEEGAFAERILDALVKKSLVYPVGWRSDAQQRFRLYEPVREFAASKLEDEERAPLLGRLVAWFARCAKRHSEGVYSPQICEHIDAMHLEFANMRFALLNAEYGEPEHAARLARVLWQYVRIAAPYRELSELISQTLERLEGSGDPAALTEVLVVIAKVETANARSEPGRRYAQRAVEIAKEHDLTELLGEAKTFLGFLGLRFQRPEEAEVHLLEAQEVLEGQGFDRLSGSLHTDFGLLWLHRGEPDRAHAHFEQALALHRRCDNPRFASAALFNLGAVDCARGHFEQASSAFEQAYQIWDAWDDSYRRAVGLMCVGQCRLALGKVGAAGEALEQATAIFDDIEARVLLAEASSWRALAHAACGEPGQAVSFSDEAIGLTELFASNEQRVVYLAHRVVIEFALGHPEEGRDYLEQASEVVESSAEGPHRGSLDVARRFVEHVEHVERKRRGDERESLQAAALAQHEVMPFAAVADLVASGEFGSLVGVEVVPHFLVASPQAEWFEWEGERVDLSRRDAPRRILTRLVEYRLAHPDRPLTKEELIEVGWPDSVLDPQAAATRIYTAIRQLRDFGLRDLIVTRDGGYLLSASIPVKKVACY